MTAAQEVARSSPEAAGAFAWTPQWNAPAHVRARFSLRAGGVSQAPYDSLNLGDHVGDDPVAVAKNRRRWGLELGCAVQIRYLRQVHGCAAVEFDEHVPDDVEADACWTNQAGRACTVLVADCLPILLCDRQGRVVAAAHAGWRGLAAGVVESIVARLASNLPGGAQILAWLGPCIGPRAFEVGEDVRRAFLTAAGIDQDAAAACFERGVAAGKWWCDLAALARRRLCAAGVGDVAGNDGSDTWCTVTQSSRFFSHRRDALRLGGSGRMAASIWLAA